MGHAERIRVTVVYALPQAPFVRELSVPAGTSLRQAVERSGLLEALPGLELSGLEAGVWGRARPLGHLLAEGDRVEVYRPLGCDPRQARRERAGAGSRSEVP